MCGARKVNNRHRRDNNHAEIADQLKQLGFSVLDLSQLGGGCPDMLIARNGITMMVEVKSGKGKLREGQLIFAGEWRGHICAAWSVDDVLDKWRSVVR